MRSGFIISVIIHLMIIVFVFLPTKELKLPEAPRFIKASLVEFESPKPEAEKPVRVVERPKEQKPDRFKRPDEKYEKPKNTIGTRQVLETKPAEQKEKPREVQRAPVSVLEKDFESNYYLGLLRDKVYRNWTVEDRPFKMECIVRFQINRKGMIDNVKLEKSSGFYNFDRAAMKAVVLSEPFPPLPANYRNERLTVFFRFENI